MSAAVMTLAETDADRTKVAETIASVREELGSSASDARMPALSPRQFMAGLWGDGLITFEDCDAFLSTRAIPGPLQALLNVAYADDDTGGPSPRKDAVILIKGATTFLFSDPNVDVIRQAQGWSVEHLRDRWTAWASL